MNKKIFFQKTIFFKYTNLPDRPGPEKMKFKKIENFRLDEWLARPDRTGTGLARLLKGLLNGNPFKDGSLGGPWYRWDLGTDGTWASRTLGLKDPRS